MLQQRFVVIISTRPDVKFWVMKTITVARPAATFRYGKIQPTPV